MPSTDPSPPSPTDPLRQLAERARAAARPLARSPAAQRSACIKEISAGLEKSAADLSAANAADRRAAEQQGVGAALLDRLSLTEGRIQALHVALAAIAAQADPVGQITSSWTRPNGLQVQRRRLPLGVIFMIYEARPNVTLDAAALCLRSGNAAILRGGSQSAQTNAVLVEVVEAAVRVSGLPSGTVQGVPSQDRAAIDRLLGFADCIQLVIPRGGASLIQHVVRHSRIPVLRHDRGVCQVFVDARADLQMAASIVYNAKVQRPGVCNALETLLCHAGCAAAFLPDCLAQLQRAGVRLRGCPRTRALVPSVHPAEAADWQREFLDLEMAVRVVDDLPAALEHIDLYGSQHTACIVSEDPQAAADFVDQVDASCVLVNASTRFHDGGELGLGAEMGISTSRLQAYGAMGAESLTCERFVVLGKGQIREA
jgi:glutamate-5-semialdehyde dehydrogenase